MDATKGLVVLPFSGWSYDAQAYNNGLQLIEFTPTSETHRRRGAHQGLGRARDLRGQSPGVALAIWRSRSSTTRTANAPAVTAELTLARNVDRRAARRRHHRRDLERLVGQRRDLVRGARAAHRQRRGVDRRRRHPVAERATASTRASSATAIWRTSSPTCGVNAAVPGRAGGGGPCYQRAEQIAGRRSVERRRGPARHGAAAGRSVGLLLVGLVRLLVVGLVRRRRGGAGGQRRARVPSLGAGLRRHRPLPRRQQPPVRRRSVEPRRADGGVDAHHRRSRRLVGQHARRRLDARTRRTTSGSTTRRTPTGTRGP